MNINRKYQKILTLFACIFLIVACNHVGGNNHNSHNNPDPNPNPKPDPKPDPDPIPPEPKPKHKLVVTTDLDSSTILRHKIINVIISTTDITLQKNDIDLSLNTTESKVLSVIDNNHCIVNQDNPICTIQLLAKDNGLAKFEVQANGFDSVLSDTVHVTKITKINTDSSASNMCVLDSEGSAYCWGYNNRGQIGPFSQENVILAPVPLVTNIKFDSLSFGGEHVCGLDHMGAAYCWGDNEYGELGDGITDYYNSTPHKVLSDIKFKTLSLGSGYSCGLDYDGIAYCWGDNKYGQLGNSSVKDLQLKPVPVQTYLRFSTISAGGSHTCGIATDGNLYCWGRNFHGELGIGTETQYETLPLKVLIDVKFVKINMGTDYSCALDLSGKAYCWGDNIYRTLGNDKNDGWDEDAPVPVLTNVKFKEIIAGNDHTCGLDFNGKVYCWGNNDLGQLGNGNLHVTEPTPVPTAVTGAAQQLVAGTSHSCVLYSDDEIDCWGSNIFGDLGDGQGGIFGSEPYSALPVTVAL